MREIILRNYETFDEIPEGLLQVKPSSNLMYVRIGRTAFIAREFVDNVIADNDIVKYKVSYYSVKDNKNILTLNIEKSIEQNRVDYAEKNKEINIQPLCKLLNINDNSVSYLGNEDIDTIIEYRGDYVSGKKTSII